MASGPSTAVHTRTLPGHVNQCRADPAVRGTNLALPVSKTNIGVWEINVASSDPVHLVGHKRPVLALAFSHDEPLLLCSAAEDHVIVWNVRKCRQQLAQHAQVRGEVILPGPGDVCYVSFSFDAELVAVCVECVVKLVSVSQTKVVAELTGHMARVTGAEFCPFYSATLVTISDDRTFKVWNVKELSLIYQSTIIAPAPLISICMNAAEPHVAVGSAGGVIKIFDLTDGNSFRQLYQIDVGKIMSKSRTSREPSPQRNVTKNGPVIVSSSGAVYPKQDEGDSGGGDTDFASVEASHSVLAMFYTRSRPRSRGTDNKPSSLHTHSAVKEVLRCSSAILAVASSHCMLQVDSRTLQPLALVDLRTALPSVFRPQVREITVSAAGYAGIGQVGEGQLMFVIGGLFEPSVHTVLWQTASQPDSDVDADFGELVLSNEGLSFSEGELTMVPTKPLTDYSPLRWELQPQMSLAGRGTSGANPNTGTVRGGRKKSDPMNQPLTFKTKVKSSGYTEAPRRTMFRPKLNPRSKSSEVCKHPSSKSQTQSLSSKISSQEYPANAGPPTEMGEKISTSTVPCTVTDLAFSASGQSLACSLANMSALVYGAPFGQKGSSVYVGHDNVVNSVSWSNSGKYLVTSSADKSAVLWDRATAEVLLKFTHLNGNVKQEQTATVGNGGFAKEVKQAQFFYMDRFVMLIAGNQLCLYKCHLDPTKDDIRRYLTKSRYKLVKKWETPSQNFTALSGVNSFHSHLAVCAGSNRDLEVFDLNVGRLAHTFTDVHTKPVHSIALNEGSTFTSQPEAAFNVFATSSTLDCIRLWDVRSKRHVLRLEGHVNNAHSCHIAFSPCGTYISSGSEDKMAYVYDVRSGTYCSKLRGHVDTVTSVAFHPARPLLATGSLDGKMVLFNAK